MGRSLIAPAAVSPKPRRFSSATQHSSLQANKGIASSFKTNVCRSVRPTRFFQIRAALSEFPNTRKYPRVGAESTGPVPAAELLGIVELAAKSGAEVVMDAVNKPRNISYKGVADLVTDTDKMSESVILDVVRKNFEDHLILGEEGGLIGGTASDYLWCIDPLDGTTNFAHCYPSFGVSVGVLFRGRPAAASVVEFLGGPMCWNTRTFTASSGGGAFCNGQKIHVSLTEQAFGEGIGGERFRIKWRK